MWRHGLSVREVAKGGSYCRSVAVTQMKPTVDELRASLEMFEGLVDKDILSFSRHLPTYQRLVEINKRELEKLLNG